MEASMSTKPTDVGVVGAGVIGLTSALLLTDAGYNVTIVAKNLPGDFSTEWASPWTGALLAPHPTAGRIDLQRKSIEYWHNLLKEHPECGLRELPITEYYDDGTDSSSIWYKDLYPDMKILPPNELVGTATLGLRYRGLVVDPNVFLPWIFTTLQHRGVCFVRQKISSLQELEKITGAKFLVNASGLGARELAEDANVHAVRGQTMFVSSPDEYSDHHKAAVLFQGSHYTYTIPRMSSRGIILGGVSQPHNARTQVDASLRPEILSWVNTITGGRWNWVDLEKDVARDIVGFRPARIGGMRVERVGKIVHAYGVGGLGYVYAFGVASHVVHLVREVGREKL